MAYTYQISFDLKPNQLDQITMGSALERVVSYMKVLLPNEPGYINTRAMYSMNTPKLTKVIFSSLWENWEDLKKHRDSGLAAEKILTEFEPCLNKKDLHIEIFNEIP